MFQRSPKSVSEKLENVLLRLEEGKSFSWLARFRINDTFSVKSLEVFKNIPTENFWSYF